MKITRNQLIAAAKELNQEFGLEPAIPTGKATPEQKIIDGLKKAAELYDRDTDEITEETLKILTEIGCFEEVKPAAKDKTKTATKPTPEPADEPAEDEDDLMNEDLLDDLKAAKSISELHVLLEDEAFDDVREELLAQKNPIKLKSSMRKHLTGELPAVKTDVKKEKKTTPVGKRLAPGTKSFQELADELLASKASAAKIKSEFEALYLTRKDIVDEVYVAKRAAIYMKIAGEKVAAETKA